MDKTKTILLKVFIILSIIGIIVFSIIAIILNLNVKYQAYNYIKNSSKNYDIIATQNTIRENIKNYYNGIEQDDDYAEYINSAISTGYEGSMLFINYLAVEDEISKGEQDKLCSLYDGFIESMNLCLDNYDDYKRAYDEAVYAYNHDYENSDYAMANLRTKNVYFIKKYIEVYKSFSVYFKYLVDLVKTYSFGNKNLFSYQEVYYLVQIGVVDNTLGDVLSDMTEKIYNINFDKEVRSYDLVDKYYDFLENRNRFDDTSLISNTNLRVFITCINEVNIYLWAGNYEEYILTLNENTRSKAKTANDFFSEHIREVEVAE